MEELRLDWNAFWYFSSCSTCAQPIMQLNRILQLQRNSAVGKEERERGRKQGAAESECSDKQTMQQFVVKRKKNTNCN